MKGEWDIHNAGDLVMYLGDFNGHFGRNIGEFDGFHGGYGAGQTNLEWRMLLEFCLEKELVEGDIQNGRKSN